MRSKRNIIAFFPVFEIMCPRENRWFKAPLFSLLFFFWGLMGTLFNGGVEELLLKTVSNYGWFFLFSYFWVGVMTVGVLYFAAIAVPLNEIFRGSGFSAFIALSLLEFKVQLLCGFSNLPLVGQTSILNFLLTNQLNQIHPPLFFASLALLFSFLITGENLRIQAVWSYFGEISLLTENLTHSLLKVAAPLIMLGGWWAYQEGNWGGWWNWDPSEMFALFFVLWALANRHRNLNVSVSLIRYWNIKMSYAEYKVFMWTFGMLMSMFIG